MFDFKQAAQKETALSRIMVGRKKLETEEIINKELTIVGFDFAPKFDEYGKRIVDDSTGEQDEFGVVVFKEYPDAYYSVGTVFTKVCKAWASEFGGDAISASEELSKYGGVRVRFSPSRTKRGNNLTAVEILA